MTEPYDYSQHPSGAPKTAAQIAVDTEQILKDLGEPGNPSGESSNPPVFVQTSYASVNARSAYAENASYGKESRGISFHQFSPGQSSMIQTSAGRWLLTCTESGVMHVFKLANE